MNLTLRKGIWLGAVDICVGTMDVYGQCVHFIWMHTLLCFWLKYKLGSVCFVLMRPMQIIRKRT